MKEFLENFFFMEGKLALCVGSTANASWIPEPVEVPSTVDVYFGPALRSREGNTKADCQGTRFLWVDADSPVKALATLPPSMRVFSGHGWHLYWRLDTPLQDIELIERLNQTLAEDVPTADKACWNVNRLLRVPGTINTKEKDKPIQVELKESNDWAYAIEDFQMLDRLDKATKHKVRTGDSRGYRSRSERDWAIITALLRSGATDALIEHIFAIQPCGEKYRETNGKKYFDNTMEKAKVSKVATASGKGFEETSEGFLRYTSRGAKRVSTFIIKPKLLLDGSAFGAEDALVTDVHASGFKWNDVTFSRSAFTGLAKLDRETPIAAWQWLGRDDDVRALLPYLMEKLQEAGLPRVAATSVLGLHKIKDEYYFLGTSNVLSSTSSWEGYEGPLAWLPSHKEHPKLDLVPECTADELDQLSRYIPELNDPGVVWPMLGWYAASPFKTWFEANNYRFPILNVVGTKGSGKTTLIQRVFMPLFGQTDPKSYDAGTTRFVTLALLGSSNGVPIAFSEFRFDAVEKFIRFILLAYDTGHDPRGKGDQTTVDYPLSAPFSVDGEDLVDDPAARERIVVAFLRPQTVAEESPAYMAFNAFRAHIPPHFGGYYIQKVLEMIKSGAALRMLKEAREAMFDAFPGKLPDRVRNNHIVAYTGLAFWSSVIRANIPPASVMGQSIGSVFDTKTGRARTMADSLVEDVVNAAAQGTSAYRWSSNPEGGVLWFQLSSAHTWWLAARRRQGRAALERDAIKAQLLEASYIKQPQVMRDTWMYGIDLQLAQDAGLDVPGSIKSTDITFKIGGV
jgi:hypothetical protein